jgi:hypothetical protein
MQGRKPTLRRQHEIVTARGYGVKLRVSGGQLEVDDGFGRQRRLRKFHRTAAPRRLVIIARNGYMSFDVARWLSDVGTAYVQLDPSGEVLATSVANGRDLPALRRAQALAADGPAGLEIARTILAQKVAGQRAVVDELTDIDEAQASIRSALDEIERAADLDALLVAEAQAAAAFWQAWAPLPVRFPRTEAARVPEHWRTFGQRASLITGGPRTATNRQTRFSTTCTRCSKPRQSLRAMPSDSTPESASSTPTSATAPR